MSANERDTDYPRDASESENRELRAAGFFSWGFGSWVHEVDLGTVYATGRALEIARSGEVSP